MHAHKCARTHPGGSAARSSAPHTPAACHRCLRMWEWPHHKPAPGTPPAARPREFCILDTATCQRGNAWGGNLAACSKTSQKGCLSWRCTQQGTIAEIHLATWTWARPLQGAACTRACMADLLAVMPAACERLATGPLALPVALGAGQPALFCPAPAAVHTCTESALSQEGSGRLRVSRVRTSPAFVQHIASVTLSVTRYVAQRFKQVCRLVPQPAPRRQVRSCSSPEHSQQGTYQPGSRGGRGPHGSAGGTCGRRPGCGRTGACTPRQRGCSACSAPRARSGRAPPPARHCFSCCAGHTSNSNLSNLDAAPGLPTNCPQCRPSPVHSPRQLTRMGLCRKHRRFWRAEVSHLAGAGGAGPRVAQQQAGVPLRAACRAAQLLVTVGSTRVRG